MDASIMLLVLCDIAALMSAVLSAASLSSREAHGLDSITPMGLGGGEGVRFRSDTGAERLE